MMDELISRQDAIDVLNRGLSKIPYVNNTDTEMIRRDERIGCIQEIRELPFVQPRKGKWIQNDNGTWSCNQCNSWIPDEQHYYANWCLYCGADMREG